MSTSKIISELTHGAASAVEAIHTDLANIASEFERLRREEAILRALLVVVENQADGHEAHPPSVAKPKAEEGHGVEDADVSDVPTGSGKPPIVRDVLLEIMRPQGFRPWTIPELIEAVQAVRPAKPPAVRVALRRLYEDEGILIKDHHRNYRLNPDRHPGTMEGSLSLNLNGQGS